MASPLKANIIFFGLICLVSCAPSSQQDSYVISRASVEASVFTTSVPGDADDPAIWIDRENPEKSLIIADDKEVNGALYAWDLSGAEVYKTETLNRPTNVDVRYDIDVNGQKEDIVACAIRGTNEIKVFKMDPKNKVLVDITAPGGISTGFPVDTYGFTLYKRSSDGTLFGFVSSKNKDHIHQIRLHGDGNGRVAGEFVRQFGEPDMVRYVEGMVADDEKDFLYAADERRGILKYKADPALYEHKVKNVFATKDGIHRDREGIALYKCPNGDGYFLLSDQAGDSLKVYERQGKNKFIGTLMTKGSTETDGIEVTSHSLGSKFPEGIIVAHNDGNKNFVIYDWRDVRKALNLKRCK
ncbi:MAG: phytase [Alphaproteobacteria bacterium]|jgi:3-phytase|nr:phytase [Alphaproteobacteria bacterium]MBT5389910.1 phytase [Alphaproteobacteria bacterium]MBT5540643.1 phytase [Alphaproteobacteria bacterium]MBT5654129.1 phytase [Alphaproteobacteria bacterium]